jgi:hypothetical protein
MNALTGVITAFGLAGAAGLNAYIPLLLVSVLGRFGYIQLSSPFDILASTPAMIAIGVLLVIEVVIDKIPAADSVNDAIQTFVRPAAGAVLFASQSGVVSGIDPVIALILGLVMALGVHGTKAITRPAINVGTMGIGAPVMSVAEDVVALVGSVLAIFLPVLFVIFALVMAFVIWRLIVLARRVRGKLRPGAS